MDRVLTAADVPAFIRQIEAAGYPKDRVYWFDPFAVELHPRNMRRVYPERDVAQLAQSILGRGRILQNLTAVAQDGKLYVVIGNKRLLAARSVSGNGHGTIPLPVVVRPQSELESLLDMVAENVVRSRPDPISEGLHYRRLLQEEGLSIQEISRQTGVCYDTIKTRLDMLRLCETAQRLMMEGKLPRGKNVVNALLTLPADVQAKAAEGFAKSRATPRVVRTVCARLRHTAERREKTMEAARSGKVYSPALEDDGVEDGVPLSWDEIEQAVSLACEQCTIRPPAWLLVESDLPRHEPQWRDVKQAVEGVCDLCDLKAVENLCSQCPLIEAVQRLGRAVDRRLRNG